MLLRHQTKAGQVPLLLSKTEQTQNSMKTQELTATQVDLLRMQRDQAYSWLCKYPEVHAEVIAKHYVNHSQIALQLLRLCEARQSGASGEEIDMAISFALGQLKLGHLHDLGIALEWPDFNQTTP